MTAIRRSAAFLLGVFLCVVASSSQAQTSPDQTQYKAGQVWKYKTAPGAENSTVLILKVEPLGKKGNLIHIRIDNMPFQNCGGLHLANALDHLAVSEKALRKSTTELLRAGTDLPDSYFQAYNEWQKSKKKIVVNRPLSEVALPSPGPMICNWRQAT